jgi:hypothetical protein
MKEDSNKLILSSITVLLVIAFTPWFVTEKFPISVYPMLSEKWDSYMLVKGQDQNAKDFLKENYINSPYFGIPIDLPIGRSYKSSLITFGKNHPLDFIKNKMRRIKTREKLCFVIERYQQGSQGAFKTSLSENFCLSDTSSNNQQTE